MSWRFGKRIDVARDALVWSLRQCGLTYDDIGTAFGFTAARAAQLTQRYERRLQKRHAELQKDASRSDSPSWLRRLEESGSLRGFRSKP